MFLGILGVKPSEAIQENYQKLKKMIKLALNIMGWIKTNWLPVAIVVGLAIYTLIINNSAYNRGYADLRLEWDKSIADAKEKIIATEKDRVILNSVIWGKYETGIKAIDDNFNTATSSLHQPASSNLRGKANTTSQLDATACNDKLYKAHERLKLAREADINTQRLISLQEWVREVDNEQ